MMTGPAAGGRKLPQNAQAPRLPSFLPCHTPGFTPHLLGIFQALSHLVTLTLAVSFAGKVEDANIASKPLLRTKHFLSTSHIFTPLILSTTLQVDTVIILIVQMSKLRHREK